MNQDEKKKLVDRIHAAEKAENRVRRLIEALETLNRGVGQINVSLAVEKPQQATHVLSYRETGDDRFQTVCWANDEPGLVEEFRDSMLKILSQRLSAAQEEYDNA